jgi:putative SOS response-associated peptidase YedK
MCGRFTIISQEEVLEKRFNARFAENFRPRYNAAPSQRLPVILNSAPHQIRLLKWGLNPPWLAKLGKKDGLINVKAETLRDKSTFKADLEKRRCLVLADGFYEWKKAAGGKKTPYRLLLKNRQPFAFAGIWETDKDKKGDDVDTFAIITTTPSELAAEIHARMPVILSEKGERLWVNPEVPAATALQELKSYPAEKMISYPVSPLLNNARHDVPAMISPARPNRVGGLYVLDTAASNFAVTYLTVFTRGAQYSRNENSARLAVPKMQPGSILLNFFEPLFRRQLYPCLCLERALRRHVFPQ